MTRLETIAVTAVLAALVVVHGPAFGQYIVIDGASGSAVKPVNPDVKHGKAPKGPAVPRPQPVAEPAKPVEPTVTGTSETFLSSKDAARDSAIRAAKVELAKYLQEQDPPIYRSPSNRLFRKMLLDGQQKVETQKVSDGSGREVEMYRVTVAVKVEPEHLRELRAEERSREALGIVFVFGLFAAVVAVFFRVDAWTKGYLTRWLALGAVGAATLVAGLWWMAR